MSNRRFGVRRIAAMMTLGALLVPALPVAPAQASPAKPAKAAKPHLKELHTAPGKVLYRPHSKTSSSLRSGRATQALVADPTSGAAKSTWDVTYTGFTTQAQTAFQAAVDIWSRTITATVPIKVSASFSDLGTGVLGSAGAASNYSSASLGDGVSYYPSALTDQLLGYDYAGNDITAQFSSTYSFYFGTDGNTPAGQIDFESVVLHELGHGLGFFGFMSYSGGSGSYAAQGRFDNFSYNALTGGSKLISLTSAGTSSTTLGSTLTGGSVYWGGPAGTASNSGVRPKLYAPSTWASGSSYSHLDETTYPAGNTNSLMTYAIGNGEAVHSPGPITVGVLNDLGYHAYITGAVTTPDAPTGVTGTAGNGQATVSWTAGSNNGSTITSSTVTATPGGKTATVTGTGTSATVTGLTNGTAYTFKVTQTNSVGTSDASSASSSVTPVGVPNAPTGVTATRTSGTGGSATVSWTASTTNGSAVTGYTVTPSPSGTAVTVGSGVTSTAVTGLTNGSSYTFTVTATSAVGSSAASSASSAVVPGTVPAAPTGVTGTAGNGSVSVAFTPGSSNGYAISGYTVTSSPGSFTGTGTSSPITVSGLTNGTAYTFTVKATNSLGTSSASTASSSVTPLDVPGQVTGVSATRGDGQATVTWTAPSSNGGTILDYTVTSSPGSITKTVTTTSATVTGLTNGTAYTFTVTARNSAGSSTTSAASTAVTPAGVPGAPTSVTATRTSGASGSVDVSWTAPSSNGATITGYTITSSPGGITKSVTTTSGTVTGLTNGTSYTFSVTATNAVGTGSAGTSSAATPATVPGAPTGVTAVAGDTTALVSWTAPASNGGSAITGYGITPSSGPSWLLDASATSFTVTGLTNGTSYTFTVNAINAAGVGSSSTASSAVTPAGVPGTPTSVTATRTSGTGGSVGLSWTAPSSNGSTITGYTVTTSPGGATTSVTGTSTTLTGLTNGTSYTFTVKATNGVGTGSAGTSNSVVPGTVPSQVTGVSATAGDTTATVSWSIPSANGYALTGFIVTPSTGSSVTVLDPTATSTTLTGLTNGTSYSFTVAATNSIGTGTASSASSSVTPSGVPGQVTGVTAAAGDSSVQLSWSAPSSNGSPITGYTITTSPGGALSSASGTSTVISGLTNGTSYTFTVKAQNANGFGTTSAASSAVTPGAVPSAVASVTAVAGDGSADVSWPAASSSGNPVLDYTVTSSPGGITKTVTTTSTTVTGLTNGTAYTFAVTARNAVGSGFSTTSSAVTPAGVPSAPTGATAVLGASTGTATVSWTASSANGSPVTGYTVTSSPGALTFTTTGTSVSATGLTEGTAYTFTVKATNAVGTSAASTATTAVTPGAVPDQVTGVTATVGDTTAALTWTAPAAHGFPLTGYVVTPSCASPVTVSDGTATSTTVTGLTNGTACTFTVAAVNSKGTGAASAATSAVTPKGVPGAPTGVTAVLGSGTGTATVSWTASSANGSPVTGYTVTSSPGALTFSSTGTSASVTGLTEGTAYTFTVKATNAVGTSVASAATTAITPGAVPDQVTGVTATAGDTTVALTWTAPAAHGFTLTGYVVTPSCASPVTVSSGSATSTTVTGLTNGTACTFTVAAVNSKGTGAASAATAAVTPKGLPGAPTGVTAALGSGTGTATVSWTASNANGSPVTGYTVTSSPGALTFSTTGTTVDVTGLTEGTAYTFTVKATNAVGTSAASSPTTAITPGSAPDQVTGVTATAGDGSVALTWTAPATHGSPLTGYVVTPSCAAPVSLSDGTATSTTVTGLTNGTACTFTVAAVNAKGIGTASAPTSAVTPSGVPGQVTNVTATRAGSGALAVTWNAPSANGTPLISYELTGGPDGPVVVDSNVAGHLVTGLTNGTPYSFTVRALNANGYGASSAASSPFAPADKPGKVTGVAAVVGTTSAQVTWSAATDNGSPVTGYVVTPSTGSPVTVGNVTAATVPGLVNATDYTFTVHAVNALGDGAESDPTAVGTADSRAPVVTLTTTPAAKSRSTTAAFAWTATDPGRSDVPTVTCSLDGSAVTCAGSYVVAQGTHTFSVLAQDDRGNLGTATWTWLVDTTNPVLSVATPARATLGTTAPVTFSATDTGSGVDVFLVRVRRAGVNGVFGKYGATVTTTAHSYAPSAPRGQTTCTSVAVRDKAGNTTAWSLDRCTAVPLDDRSLSATSAFKRLTTSAAWASTYSSTTKAGQYLRLSSVTARRVVLVATTCRTCGVVKVAVGSTVKTVNLASTTTHWRVVFVVDLGAVRSGALTVTTTSAKTVNIDGVGPSRV